MIKHTIIAASFFLISCHCTKDIVMISPQNVTLENSCPKDGDCKIEVFENKSLNILTDDIGSLYYKIDDSFDRKVIKYTYDKKVKGDLQDANYREEIVFEVDNETKQLSLSNEKLQETKLLFGRFCFCRGQTGNYKVTKGNLNINKDKINLEFEITEVPQIINNISISIQ